MLKTNLVTDAGPTGIAASVFQELHDGTWVPIDRVSQSRVRRVLSTGADFTKITAVSHFIKNSNLKNKKIRISDASHSISIV